MNASDGSVGRYYDPATGQFLSVDPLVDDTGQAYAYTGDDPVNEADPTGRSAPSNPACAGSGPIGASPAELKQLCNAEQQNSQNVAAEELANQGTPRAHIIDIAGAIGAFVSSHKIGELEIAGAILTVAAAIATGGTSLAAEEAAEAAIEATSEAAAESAGGGTIASAATSTSTVLNGISTAVNTLACLSGRGEAAGVSCAAAALGAVGVGFGVAAELAVAPAALSQLSLLFAITSVVGLLPAWAAAIIGG
jgi:uncharacterized protein RhaS with RHS repeats